MEPLRRRHLSHRDVSHHHRAAVEAAAESVAPVAIEEVQEDRRPVVGREVAEEGVVTA